MIRDSTLTALADIRYSEFNLFNASEFDEITLGRVRLPVISTNDHARLAFITSDRVAYTFGLTPFLNGAIRTWIKTADERRT